MPNKTFTNLPVEKQENIIDIALKEFITHDYEAASLNQIISDVGVAKGSFYRYFDSKKDLYDFLIEDSLNKKFTHISEFQTEKYEDIFEALRDYIIHYLRFNSLFNLKAVFLLNAYKNNSITFEQFMFLKGGKERLMRAIENCQKNGQLSQNFDTDFVVYSISQTLISMAPYIKQKFNIDDGAIISEEALEDEKAIKIIEQFINFLKCGFGNK